MNKSGTWGWLRIVLIMLEVLIGANLATHCMAQDEDVAGKNDAELKPLIERFPDGWIDWQNGFYFAIAKGYVEPVNLGASKINREKERAEDGQRKTRAKRAAEVLAARKILEIASNIRIDSRWKFKAYQHKNATIRLEGIVRGHEVIHGSWHPNAPNPYYEIRMRAPLHGVTSITAEIIDHEFAKRGEDHLHIAADDEVEFDEMTLEVIIDARDLKEKVNPAIFPTILNSATDRTIYGIRKSNRDAAARRGMARYAVTDIPFEKLSAAQFFDDESKIASKSLEMPYLFASIKRDGALLAQAAEEAEEAPEQAEQTEEPAEPPKKKRRRRRLVVKATESRGLMNTNVVVSAEDAEKIMEADESDSVLKNCNVIIITDTSIAGTEGRLRQPPRAITVLVDLSLR